MIKPAILCVDDDDLILQSLKRELRHRYTDRFRYEFALSAEEALDLIEDLVAAGVRILLIISDWLMPGMKGDEFLIRVKQMYPQIHLMMITGHADQEAVNNLQKSVDLVALLEKPWKRETLYSFIDPIALTG